MPPSWRRHRRGGIRDLELTGAFERLATATVKKLISARSEGGERVMIGRTPCRRPTGAGTVNAVLAVIASVVLLCACQAARAQEIAERYVLSAGERGETVFRVFANLFGIVPADGEQFEAVVAEVRVGNDVVRANKDEQIIIAKTVSPARTYAAIQDEASKLMARLGAKVRLAAPVVATGETDRGGTAGIRDILLPTNVVIVKFHEGVRDDTVKAEAATIGLRLVQRHPVDKRVYYFVLPADTKDINVFTASKKFGETKTTEYAVPDFLMFAELRQPVVNDEFFHDQWPLDNTGQSSGLIDADIDADLAWRKFGFGNPGTIIAVIDGGFDMTHPDLAPNIYVNVDEEFGTVGVDDDGNGYLDDLHGWDFTSGCSPVCGDPDPTPTASGDLGGRHGTMTAGAAAARGNNARGVSGSCPHCKILPLKISFSWTRSMEQDLAFAYAQNAGADIITNSWGYPLHGVATQPVVDAINRATAAGAAIFFAMSSTGEHGYQNDCSAGAEDISSLDNVIAVSASNNVDTRTPAGYGDCMDIVAPTDNEDALAGTLWPVSTDMRGTDGYNNSYRPTGCSPLTELVPPPPDALSYTFCANGTSYAAPLTAGVAGLMVSLDRGLTPERVRQVLQDTADKIEPSMAAYDPKTGFSSPQVAPTPQRSGSPGGVGSTHGFGRVNAFEAVRLVAPTSHGGRGDVDLFLRDNQLDWGNTERPSDVLIPEHQSASIKIDAPPYESAPPMTPQEFVDFADEEPRAEAINKIYVLVRNRGRRAATNVTVKLAAGKPLDPLPPDFWGAQLSAGSTITTSWALVDTKMIPSVGYSGASITLKPGDGAQIAAFDFDAPALDPSLPGSRDYSLLAVVDSLDDPVSDDSRASFAPDVIAPNDNNVTLRDVSLQ
jgi:hypothetical protein